MSGLAPRSLKLLARNNMAAVAKRDLHVKMEGVPGGTLPFNITNNRWRLMLGFTVFVGSAFSMPFLMVRHQLKKKSGL